MNAVALAVLVAVLVGVVASVVITWAGSVRPVFAILIALGIVMLLAVIGVTVLAVYSR